MFLVQLPQLTPTRLVDDIHARCYHPYGPTGIILLAQGFISRSRRSHQVSRTTRPVALAGNSHDISITPLRDIKPPLRPAGPPEAKEIRFAPPTTRSQTDAARCVCNLHNWQNSNDGRGQLRRRARTGYGTRPYNNARRARRSSSNRVQPEILRL